MPINISEVISARRTNRATTPYFLFNTVNSQYFLESGHLDILNSYHLNYKFVFEGNLNILLYPKHSEVMCRLDNQRVVDPEPRGTVVQDNISYSFNIDLYNFSTSSIQNEWRNAIAKVLQDIQKHADALAKRDAQAHNERFLQKRTPHINKVSECMAARDTCLREYKQLELDLAKAKAARNRALVSNTKTQKAQLTAEEQAEHTRLNTAYRLILDNICDAQSEQDVTLVAQLQQKKSTIIRNIKSLENKTEQVSAPVLEQVGNYCCAGINVVNEIQISGQLSDKKAELVVLRHALTRAKEALSAFDNQHPETHYHYDQQATSGGHKYLLREASITINPASKESVKILQTRSLNQCIRILPYV